MNAAAAPTLHDDWWRGLAAAAAGAADHNVAHRVLQQQQACKQLTGATMS